MNVVFFTGMKFTQQDGKYFHETFKYELIKERYLSVFDNIYIFASEKQSHISVSSREECSSGENVFFTLSKKYKSGKDVFNPFIVQACKREIKTVLKNAECAIIRLPSNIGIWACEVCEDNKFPYLIEVVGNVYESMMQYSLYTKVLAPVEQYKMKKAIAKSKYAIYVSKQYLQDIYPMKGVSTNCSNVRLGVVEDYLEEKRIEQIRKRRGENNRTIKLGTCGAIDLKYKGHKYVFEAMKELKEKYGVECRYYLAGGGSNVMLKNKAQEIGVLDQVEFLGQMKHEDVCALLDDIDIYIQPSMTEGLPRALIEGMSRGCSCIGSNVGGIPELLLPELIFERGNVKEITKKVLYAIDHQEEISRFLFEASKYYETEKIDARRIQILRTMRGSVENER